MDDVDHSDRWRLWINATVEPDLPPVSGELPRAHVTAWRERAPGSDDALVEQDLVVCRTPRLAARNPIPTGRF